jgi:site-specific recombinase XerD
MRRAELAALEDKDVDVRMGQIRVFGKRRKERVTKQLQFFIIN